MTALVLALALLLAEPQRAPQQRQQPAQPQQRGSDSLPVAVKLLNTGQSPDEAQQEDRRSAESTQINRRQLTANYILAGLAMLSLGLSLWTFHRSHEVTQRQLRAYVAVKALPLEWLPTPGQQFTFGLQLHNHGQTPAHDMRLRMAHAITRHPHTKADEGPTTWTEDEVVGGFVLDPSESRGINSALEWQVNAAESEAIRTGQLEGTGEVRLNIRGYLSFRDAFGKRHTRHFCCFYGGSNILDVSYCPIHNTAD